MQYAIQKANIYASSLATRSYLVEKYFNLCDAHDRAVSQSSPFPSDPPGISVTPTGTENTPLKPVPTSSHDPVSIVMREERENIVKDLLVVLSTISTVNCEPSADSFVSPTSNKFHLANLPANPPPQTMKIRSIAGTLLNASDQRKGPIALQAQEHLSAFLQVLVKLERVNPAHSDPEHPDEDEESELRHWADLREYQTRLAQHGGVLSAS
nr:hypothetical protein CFP56_79600 [Quercus suber]